jgi:DNA-binding GntR family transcriptional regulator
MTDLLGGRQVQRHAPIREQVASIIRDAIVEMRLLPGQLLIERQLVEMTQASRPSVREGLRQLEAEGLVESFNGRGTIVASADREIAGYVYEARAELEGLAAALFATRATPAEVLELRSAFEQLRATVDEDRGTSIILEAKNRFYEVLFRGAGNPILIQLIGMLQRRVSMLRAQTLKQPGRPQQSVEEIEELLRAVESADPTAARAAATQHVNQAARTIFTWMEGEGVRPVTPTGE